MRSFGKGDIEGPISFQAYEYGVDVLNNGLKVLFVSHPELVDRAACAIGVGVGNMADPKELNGLAHFCEHMLFMGTSRYPDEQEYQEYVQKNGGMTNAFTSDQVTCYYATVKVEALDGLVDRTAEFFVSPSFNAGAVDREVEAVNSEHEKDLQNDNRRRYQLMKALSNQRHPFSNFGTGSNATLRRLHDFNGDESKSLTALRNALLEFHRKNYSSNNMAAVVVGKESLDELRKMTIPRLERIPNYNVTVPRGRDVGKPEHVLNPEHKKLLVDVVPVKEADRKLEFIFTMPDQRDYYLSKPASFVSHVLGHEGKGSILDILKCKHLATSLFGGCLTENHGESLFGVAIDLVDDEAFGDSAVEYVGKLVFGVLRLLLIKAKTCATEFEELVHDEQQVNLIRWKYRPLPDVQDIIRDGVTSLLAYEPQHILKEAYINCQTDIPLLVEHLEILLKQFDSVNVWRTGVKFAETCKEVEPIYKSKYAVQGLKESWVKAWRKIAVEDDDAAVTDWLAQESYRMVEKNRYLPERLAMKANPEFPLPTDPPKYLGAAGPGASREQVLQDPLQIWYKMETSFNLPQFMFNGRIVMPTLLPTAADLKWLRENDVTAAKLKQDYAAKNRISDLVWPARVALVYLYVRIILESLNDQLYDARLAGVVLNMSATTGRTQGLPGINFEVGGFDDKGSEIMKLFVESASSLKHVSDIHIKTSIVGLLRSLTNKMISTDPYLYSIQKSAEAAMVTYWDEKDVLEAMKKMTLETAVKFLRAEGPNGEPILNPELLAGSTIIGGIVGNLTEEEVRRDYACPEMYTKVVKDLGGHKLQVSENDWLIKYKDLRGLHAKVTQKDPGSSDSFNDVYCVKIPTLNAENPNCAVTLSWQAPECSMHMSAFNNVMSIMLGDKFYDDLRTKQQLGYVVAMANREIFNTLTRCFLTQSSVKTTEYVLGRMAAFAKQKCLDLSAATEDDFRQCCQAVISQLEEKPKEMMTVLDRMMSEVMTFRLEFDRRQKQIEYLQSAYTLDKFRADMKRMMTSGQWLAVLCYPEKKEGYELDRDELGDMKTWLRYVQVNKLRYFVDAAHS